MTENIKKNTKPGDNKINSHIDIAQVDNIESLYLKHRSEFILFGKQYGLPDEDILDAYQDAILIYFQKVESGSLVLRKGSPKTYLFSIGKFKLIDKIRKDSKLRSILKNIPQEESIELEDYNELNERQQQLKTALFTMGRSCKELLNLFYFKQYSIKEIKDAMEYKTDNVVKAHKSRCIKKLKEILNGDDGIE